MASAIDPTKPTSGTATTESVRANFAAAKSEIEALQAALAAVPQGIGSLTMTAGEALSARDVAVLGADLKVYKSIGGAAVATETTALPPLYGMGVAYNHATSTVVLVYRDTITTLIRVVSGTINSDGTVTLGAGFTTGPIGNNVAGVLGVCHVHNNVFFMCWRSTATEMSALAFTAIGTYAGAPQPRTTWATVSSSTNYNTSTVVAVSGGRLIAATPMASTDSQVHAWDLPGADCVLGYRYTVALGINLAYTGWAALVDHEGFAYWFYNKAYADGQPTYLRVIDANMLTVSSEIVVTGTPSSIGRVVQAYSHVKVGQSVYLAVCDLGTTTGYKSWIGCKEIQLDAGAVTLPGGINAATLVINQSSLATSGNSYLVGSIGYDATSDKLVIGFQRGGSHFYKTVTLSTGVIDPLGVAAGSYYSVQTTDGHWPAASVSHPTQGVLFFRNTTSQVSGLIWNLKPSRPTNLTSVTYMGFVKDGVAANAAVTVLTSGAIVSGFSGLTPLSTYYALPANTISAVQGADGVQAGVAISPTQLMLRS